MAKFSGISTQRLSTCHQDLQVVFNYVIKEFDCKILYGHRTISEQQELFRRGREMSHGEWIIKDPHCVVTYCDGANKKSMHNYYPSRAIDVIPYPIDWNNINRMRFFAGRVLGIAQMLREYGAISSEIISGFDWNGDTFLKDTRFLDAPHFQLK